MKTINFKLDGYDSHGKMFLYTSREIQLDDIADEQKLKDLAWDFSMRLLHDFTRPELASTESSRAEHDL